MLLVIVFLLATPAIVKRLDAAGRRRLTGLATAAMVAGVGATALFAGSTGPAVVLSCAAGCLIGFGSGVLLSVCGAALTRLNLEDLERAVILSVLYTPLCSLFVPALTGTVLGVLLVAALPLGAGLLLLSVPDVPPAPIESTPQLAVLPRPSSSEVRAMLVCCLLYHVASALIIFTHSAENIPAQFNSLAEFFQAHLAAGSVLTLVVCYFFMTRSHRLDFSNACRLSLPTLLVGAALLPVGAVPFASVAGSALIAFSTTYFSLMTYIAFVKAEKVGVLGPYEAVGWFMGFCEIGVLVANLVGMGTLLVADASLQLSIQVAVIVAALSLVVFLAPGSWKKGEGSPVPCSFEPPSGVPAGAAAASASSAQPGDLAPAETVAGEGRLSDAPASPMARLAEAQGLTAREREVCELIAQGRSRPYIRELLCVSKNTVDSHVKHAYAKLGVHSNQELIDLIQRQD